MDFEGQKIISDHKLLCKSCSTKQDLSNDVSHIKLLQNYFFHIATGVGRTLGANGGRFPWPKNSEKKISILFGPMVNFSEMSFAEIEKNVFLEHPKLQPTDNVKLDM